MKGLLAWLAARFGQKTEAEHRKNLFDQFYQLRHGEKEEMILAITEDGEAHGVAETPKVDEPEWALRDSQGAVHRVPWTQIKQFTTDRAYA